VCAKIFESVDLSRMSRVPRKTYKKEDVLKILLAESSDDDLDASDNESGDDCLPPSETSDSEENNIEEVEHSDCQADVEPESEDECEQASTGGVKKRGRSMTRGGRGRGRRTGDVSDERVTPNVRQFVAKSGVIWASSPVRIQQCKRAPKNIVRFEGGVRGVLPKMLQAFLTVLDCSLMTRYWKLLSKKQTMREDEHTISGTMNIRTN